MTLSDKFDSHSFNPDISTGFQESLRAFPQWQLKESRKRTILHANVLIPSLSSLPLPLRLKLQPPLQTWFLAAKQPSHNPVEMREERGRAKKKKEEQTENCMETNGRKMIDERRAKGWTRNPRNHWIYHWTVQCFNTDLDLHRGKEKKRKKKKLREL